MEHLTIVITKSLKMFDRLLFSRSLPFFYLLPPQKYLYQRVQFSPFLLLRFLLSRYSLLRLFRLTSHLVQHLHLGCHFWAQHWLRWFTSLYNCPRLPFDSWRWYLFWRRLNFLRLLLFFLRGR